MGKPIRDMLAVDVPQSALTFRYFAELSDKVEGAVTATAVDAFHYTLREPLGVVGCIVPWNFPLMMTAWKIAPALAAGNSVVLKPAENSPLSALLLAELFVEAGGPAGVLNVVNGSGLDAGAPLALHNDVAKISFTGSTATGKKMLEYSAQLEHEAREPRMRRQVAAGLPRRPRGPRPCRDLRHQRHLPDGWRVVQRRLAAARRQAHRARVRGAIHRARAATPTVPATRSIPRPISDRS